MLNLGITDDNALIEAASNEQTSKVRGPRSNSIFQSGESRAWGRSGDVD